MKKEKEKIWKDHRSSVGGDKTIDKKEEEEIKWIITIYNNEANEEITLIIAIIVGINDTNDVTIPSMYIIMNS